MKTMTKEQIVETITNASNQINCNLMKDINNMFQQMKSNTTIDVISLRKN